jgi:hypothetical protein
LGDLLTTPSVNSHLRRYVEDFGWKVVQQYQHNTKGEDPLDLIDPLPDSSSSALKPESKISDKRTKKFVNQI